MPNRSMHCLPLLLLASALVTSACASSDGTNETRDEAQQPIRGGTVDSGDPAVGYIRYNDGSVTGASCTGTLIAPDVVLTAAHCVYGRAYTNPGTFFQSFGTGVDGSNQHQIVTSAVAPGFEPNSLCPGANDVGLILLSTSAGVASADLRQPSYGTPAVGATCHIVGFGDDGTGARGTKREADVIVDPPYDASHVTVHFGTGLSQGGDSGGPLFCKESDGVTRIAAVTECGSQINGGAKEHFSRVDTQRAWIARQIAQWHSRIVHH